MFNRHRATRILFIQYVFSNIFIKTDIDKTIHILKLEDEDFFYDEKFLPILLKTYDEKQDLILDNMKNIEKNIDMLVYSVILGAVTEMFTNKPKVVISEYLKISDLLELNTAFINAMLDNVSKNFIH